MMFTTLRGSQKKAETVRDGKHQAYDKIIMHTERHDLPREEQQNWKVKKDGRFVLDIPHDQRIFYQHNHDDC